MYHLIEGDKLYDFDAGTEVEIKLKSGRSSVDIDALLEDVSVWMESHPQIIKEKYLPFSCLAVGLVPSQASAFLFGCFIGRAMEKNKISISSEVKQVDKKTLAGKVKRDIKDQMGWLSDLLSHLRDFEEEDSDDEI